MFIVKEKGGLLVWAQAPVGTSGAQLPVSPFCPTGDGVKPGTWKSTVNVDLTRSTFAIFALSMLKMPFPLVAFLTVTRSPPAGEFPGTGVKVYVAMPADMLVCVIAKTPAGRL